MKRFFELMSRYVILHSDRVPANSVANSNGKCFFYDDISKYSRLNLGYYHIFLYQITALILQYRAGIRLFRRLFKMEVDGPDLAYSQQYLTRLILQKGAGNEVDAFTEYLKELTYPPISDFKSGNLPGL